MEGNTQIEKNREALKRILASLVAMAGMAGGASTLPRRLHSAILRLLRPAESAARRLIIVASRGIVVTLPPFRPRKPKPKISDTVAAMRRLGLAVTLSKEDFARYEAENKAAALRAARPRMINLPLLDALKKPVPHPPPLHAGACRPAHHMAPFRRAAQTPAAAAIAGRPDPRGAALIAP